MLRSLYAVEVRFGSLFPEIPFFSLRALPLPHQEQHLAFEGFRPDAFAILERLRAHPHIEQYRSDKAEIDRYVVEPFKRYRDDLVVHWVLPRGLPFETERGVFSRLLKNDFGAGGAHHHLWMAFYRPPLRRLQDVQLSHGIYPDGFAWGLYVGAYAGDLFRGARGRMIDDAEGALALLNPLLASGYAFSFAPRVTKKDGDPTFSEPLAAFPEGLASASGIWVRRKVDRQRVLDLGPGLVAEAIRAQDDLWPLYRWWVEAADPGGVPSLP